MLSETQYIGIMVRVFTNGLGDRGSIPGCITLSIIKYRSRGKWSNPRKRVMLSPTPWCTSYWEGSLQVTLNNGRPTYLYIYIYKTKFRSSHGTVVNMLDYDIVISKFKLFAFMFTFGLIPSSHYELNSIIAVIL